MLGNTGIYKQNGVGNNMQVLQGAQVDYNPIPFFNPLYQQQKSFISGLNSNPFN